MSLLSTLRGAASHLPGVKKVESGLQQIAGAVHQAESAGANVIREAEHAVLGAALDVYDEVQNHRVTGTLREVPHDQLRLKADFRDADRVGHLVKSGGFERVSLTDLPLDRQGAAGSDRGLHPAIPYTEMRHQQPEGFTFNTEDQHTHGWFPQAVTTSADANPQTGKLDGKSWAAVTWHSDKGDRARISFVDTSDPKAASVRYRNVELMVPDAKGEELVPLASHVGGVSWVGHYLYVAQTGGGVRVFDVNQLLKVKDAGKVPSGTAPYMLPQVGYYHVQRAPGETPHAGSGTSPIFSGLAVDHTGKTPALLSQEYDAKSPGGRIIRWAIDPQTGRLQETNGEVQPTNAWSVPLKRISGIARTKDGFRIATMGTPASTLWTARDGQRPQVKDSLGRDVQQFSYDPTRNQIWTVAEMPGQRMVWRFNP